MVFTILHNPSRCFHKADLSIVDFGPKSGFLVISGVEMACGNIDLPCGEPGKRVYAVYGYLRDEV